MATKKTLELGRKAGFKPHDLIDEDPFSGTSAWFAEGADPGVYHCVTLQDVEPILETNLALRNMTKSNQRYNNLGKGPAGKETWHLEATIPVTWMPEFIRRTSNFRDETAVRRLLNDKSCLPIRTTTRKL